MTWNEIKQFLNVFEDTSILLVCAAKIRHLKQQDAGHERDPDQPDPTRAQQMTYPTNKQARGCQRLHMYG